MRLTTTIEQHVGNHHNGTACVALKDVITDRDDCDDGTLRNIHNAMIAFESLGAEQRKMAKSLLEDCECENEAAMIRRAIAVAIEEPLVATRNVEKYNGWANRQTWVIFSWLENDEQNLMLTWAAECAENKDAAIEALAHRIRGMHENLAVDQVKIDSALGDLLMAALDAVSWREIAKHYLDAAEISTVR